MNIPSKNGYYWIQLVNCHPEIVRVCFNVNWKRKSRTMVFGNHWNATLEELVKAEVKWSDEIVCPF
jgi:hypothetical protein